MAEDFRTRQTKGRYLDIPVTATWPDGTPAYNVSVTFYKVNSRGAGWVSLSLRTNRDGTITMPFPLADEFALYAALREANDYNCRSPLLRVDTSQGTRWREYIAEYSRDKEGDFRRREIRLELRGAGCGVFPPKLQ